MNDDNKELILALMVDTLKKHPDWLASILYAMQTGITSALQEERTKTSDVAYALAYMIDVCPKQTRKHKSTIMKGLIVLQSVFFGSKFGDTLQEIINE